MNRITVLLVLLIKLTDIQANCGGCGPAISIKNTTITSKILGNYVDTLRLTLNPSDSTLVFSLSIFEGNCDFEQVKWSKNGVPIPGGLKCYAAGPGVYNVSAVLNYSPVSVFIIVTTITTSVDELKDNLASDIFLFPNPSSTGIFTLERALGAEGCSIAIYDLNGQLMKKLTMNTKDELLDISDCKKGTYFLEWTMVNGSKKRKKFIFD
jgi:hypothetical protein